VNESSSSITTVSSIPSEDEAHYVYIHASMQLQLVCSVRLRFCNLKHAAFLWQVPVDAAARVEVEAWARMQRLLYLCSVLRIQRVLLVPYVAVFARRAVTSSHHFWGSLWPLLLRSLCR
jgi:hypothetical protein